MNSRHGDVRGRTVAALAVAAFLFAGCATLPDDVLDWDLEIHAINGIARIVQDDLQGTYNACFEEAGPKACSVRP